MPASWTRSRRLPKRNHADERYVSGGFLWPAGRCSVDEFTAGAGDTVLMFTDGVDECHYRRPATSVRPEHIIEVVGRPAAQPTKVSSALAELALAGVDGHPGGQDNIAVIVARV